MLYNLCVRFVFESTEGKDGGMCGFTWQRHELNLEDVSRPVGVRSVHLDGGGHVAGLLPN